MLPSRYIEPRPAQVKKDVAQIAHLSPPLKGLNLATKTNVGDPLTAVLLTNFVVDDDRITMRGGYRRASVITSTIVNITSVKNSNPCVCTVAAGDIGKFANGQTISISGVANANMLAANGRHVITSVGTPANTFTLVNVDTSLGSAPQTVGVTAIVPPLLEPKIPIWHLIPWHGAAPKLMAATNDSLFNAETGVLIKAGFNGGDWHWTAFSNLSQQDYTVMCNGVDGVWSWDGSILPSVDHPAVTVTALSNTNPAQVTVANTDIAKFYEGQIVLIAGADTAHAAANGYHAISQVNAPVANAFKLVGVDLTGTTALTAPTGVTADPPSTGVAKELVTAPASAPWMTPNNFHIVVAHMNRLFLADASNLAIYYLPIQQKSGEVKILPLNAYFKRGGYIKAMFTWSVDGGTGIDDMLCIFTSNGECLIYNGSNPDTDFAIKGVFRFDAPMSKHAIVNYGGELYVLISTGLVPMSTLMKAESEQLGQVDKSVLSVFTKDATRAADKPGWQAILNPQSGRLFCNIPQGAPNIYHQMVRHMPKPVWSEFNGLPARCWAWVYPYMWFGDDKGNINIGHTNFLNDNGQAITVDLQMAWSQYKTPGVKHFKMVKTYFTSDGEIQPVVDIKCDYDFSKAENIPDVTFQQSGAVWDVATWDVDYWAAGPFPNSAWNGVGRMGRVGAIRLTASIKDCEFSVTGFDLIYETGAALG
jgi:hypothetical protein